jgi:hypothetical protein
MYLQYIAYRYTKKNPSPCTYSDPTVAANATAANSAISANAVVTRAAVVANTCTASAREVNAHMNASRHEFIFSMWRVYLFLPYPGPPHQMSFRLRVLFSIA